MAKAKIGEGQEGQAPEKPGLLSQMLDNAKQSWEELRIGDGHMGAMGRLGLAELRNAFNPSRESVADKDGGLYGAAIQSEIANAREGPDKKSMTMDDMRAAAKGKDEENGADGREQGRGGMEP